MQLVSVNTGREESIRNGKKTASSGIFKRPAAGPVEITPLGLKGDTIVDTDNHGGPDQAVYVYGMEDYAFWQTALGRDLLPGTFGENLTINGLESALFNIGDRLVIGPVTLEVTAPRIPCGTLAARMDDPQFLKRFRQAGRPGLYCRVIQTGMVQAGDQVTRVPYSGEKISVLELVHSFYEPDLDETELRRLLATPIGMRARIALESRISR